MWVVALMMGLWRICDESSSHVAGGCVVPLSARVGDGDEISYVTRRVELASQRVKFLVKEVGNLLG